MSRSSSPKSLLLMAALPAVLSFATACDPEEPDPVVPSPPPASGLVTFARATQAQREAALAAAFGLTTQRAVDLLYFAQADHEADPSCPVRSESGDHVEYAAPGCAGASGLHYAGNAQAFNSPVSGDFHFLDDARDSQPSQLVFKAFTVASAGGKTETFDGHVDQSQAIPFASFNLKTDLFTSGAGFELAFRTDYHCDDVGCIGAGTGDLGGKDGRYTIFTNLIDANGAPLGRGTIELHGDDVLSVDLDERFVGRDCWAYRIDGALAGEFCRPVRAVPPIKARTRLLTPDLVRRAVSGNVLCPIATGERLVVQFRDVVGADSPDVAGVVPESIFVTLVQGGARSETRLHAAGHATSVGEGVSVIYFFQEGLTPGVDTALSCVDQNSIGLRFDATLTDGQHLCLLTGNPTAFPDAAGCTRE